MLTGSDINSDRTLFSYWYYNRNIEIRQLHNPDFPPVIIELNSFVDFVRFHPSQNLLAVSSARSVRVFDAVTGQPVSPRFPHEKTANQVEFTPDGKRMISVSGDSFVRIWNTGTYEEIAKYDFRIGALSRLAIAPDGLTFAIANFNKDIVVADIDT